MCLKEHEQVNRSLEVKNDRRRFTNIIQFSGKFKFKAARRKVLAIGEG